MKTNYNLQYLINKTIFPVLLFIFLTPGIGDAQTTSTAPVCNPVPTDPALLDLCVEYWANNVDNYQDISNPMNGISAGIHGMDAAYDPINGRLLFLSTDGTHVYGQLYDAHGGMQLTPIGSMFRVDQGNLYAGGPRVLYNADVQNYFIIWGDARPGRTGAIQGDSSIYGRFMNLDGSFVGNDFPIHNQFNVGLADFAYDSVNKKYLITFEANEDMYLRTVDLAGTVSNFTMLDNSNPIYEGQSDITYNSTLNEYWYVYIWATADDTTLEDDRVMFARLDATTMQKIGSPVQLSTTRVGRNNFSGPNIEYNAVDGAAVVVWSEAGRNPGMLMEVYGRTIYDNLTMSAEYPVLSSQTYQGSDFLGGSDNLILNTYTNSFMLAGEDNNGGTTFVEFLSDGTILTIREAIAYTNGTLGNFNPGLVGTPIGSYIYTSVNYAQPKIVSYQSSFVTPPTPVAYPPTPRKIGNLDTTSVPKALAMIYLYSLGIAGLLAVGATVLGGYLVMTSRGNAAQAEKGKDYIRSALIGLVILLGAFIILNTVNSDLTDFQIPSLDLLK